MQKAKPIITISALTTIYLMSLFVDVPGPGYSRDNLWPHFYYMFFHANVFHLALNCLGAYFLVREIKPLIAAYLISVALSFILYAKYPTLGFSAPLLVLVGYYGNLLSRNPFREPRLLMAYSILIAGLFNPKLNGLIHIAAMLCGILLSLLNNVIARLRYDYRRVGKGK